MQSRVFCAGKGSNRQFCPPVCAFAQVCDLLDLLGGTEEILQPRPAVGGTAPGLPTNTASTAGGDLLDLLGGLEPAPLTPGLNLRHTYTHAPAH